MSTSVTVESRRLPGVFGSRTNSRKKTPDRDGGHSTDEDLIDPFAQDHIVNVTAGRRYNRSRRGSAMGLHALGLHNLNKIAPEPNVHEHHHNRERSSDDDSYNVGDFDKERHDHKKHQKHGKKQKVSKLKVEIESSSDSDDGGDAFDSAGAYMRSFFERVEWVAKGIAGHPFFNQLILIVIIMAGLSVGVQASMDVDEDQANFVNQTIKWVFLVEAVLKILSVVTAPWRYFVTVTVFIMEDDRFMRKVAPNLWHIYDLAIVVTLFVGYDEVAVLRLFRILKLTQRIRKMRILLAGLFAALRSVGYILFVFALMYFFFGILGMRMFHDYAPEYFGDLGTTIVTLFSVSTLSNWGEAMLRTVFRCDDGTYWPDCTDQEFTDYLAVAYWVVFILLSSMVLWNLVIGVITTSMDSARQRDEEGQTELEKYADEQGQDSDDEEDPSMDGSQGGKSKKSKKDRADTDNHFMVSLAKILVWLRLRVPNVKVNHQTAVFEDGFNKVMKKLNNQKMLIATARLATHSVATAMQARMERRWMKKRKYVLTATPKELKRRRRTRLDPRESPFAFLANFCDKLAAHPMFELVNMGVIVFAAVVIALRADPDSEMAQWEPLDAAEFIIKYVFLTEALVKFLATGYQPWMYFCVEVTPVIKIHWWNVLDLAVVIASFLDRNDLATFRLLRLMRMLRLANALPNLQHIVGAMFHSFFSLALVSFLLAIIFFMFAIVGIYLFRGNDKLRFGSLRLAMLTLFQASTMDEWPAIMNTNMYGCDWATERGAYPEKLCTDPNAQTFVAPAYFVVFLLVTGLVVLNLTIGIIAASMEETRQARQDEDDLEFHNLKRVIGKVPIDRYIMFSEQLCLLLIARRGDIQELLRQFLKPMDVAWWTRHAVKMEQMALLNKDKQRKMDRIIGNIDLSVVELPKEDLELEDLGGNKEAKLLLEKTAKDQQAAATAIELAEQAVNEAKETAQDDNASEDFATSVKSQVKYVLGLFALLCAAVKNHRVFRTAMAVCVVAAGLSNAMNTYPELQGDQRQAWLNIFVRWFVVAEVGLKLGAVVFKPWLFAVTSFKPLLIKYWNLFDLLVMLLVVVEIPGASVLLLLRVLRVANHIDSWRMLLGGLFFAMESLKYVVLMLVLVFYLFAIIGMQMFREQVPEHFGTIGLTFMTLFQVATLAEWGEIMHLTIFKCEELDRIYPECLDQGGVQIIGVGYWLGFILCSAMVVLKLDVGVITNSMHSVRRLIIQERLRELAPTEQQAVTFKERIQRQLRGVKAQFHLGQPLWNRGHEQKMQSLHKAKLEMLKSIDEYNNDLKKLQVAMSDVAKRLRIERVQAIQGYKKKEEEAAERTDKFSKTVFGYLFAFCDQLAAHPLFQAFNLTAVVVSAVIIGFFAEPDAALMTKDFIDRLNLAELVIRFIFLIEAVVKFLSYGFEPWLYFMKTVSPVLSFHWWNLLDFAVVVASFLEFSEVSALRLLRLLRVLKLVRALPTLQAVLAGLLGSLRSLGFVFILLLLTFYVFSIGGVLFFASNDPLRFGTMPRAMYTLIQISTLDAWPPVLYDNMQGCQRGVDEGSYPEEFCTNSHGQPWLAVVFFFSFELLCGMVMLNLMIGIIAAGMEEASEALEAEETLVSLKITQADMASMDFKKYSAKAKVIKAVVKDMTTLMGDKMDYTLFETVVETEDVGADYTDVTDDGLNAAVTPHDHASMKTAALASVAAQRIKSSGKTSFAAVSTMRRQSSTLAMSNKNRAGSLSPGPLSAVSGQLWDMPLSPTAARRQSTPGTPGSASPGPLMRGFSRHDVIVNTSPNNAPVAAGGDATPRRRGRRAHSMIDGPRPAVSPTQPSSFAWEEPDRLGMPTVQEFPQLTESAKSGLSDPGQALSRSNFDRNVLTTSDPGSKSVAFATEHALSAAAQLELRASGAASTDPASHASALKKTSAYAQQLIRDGIPDDNSVIQMTPVDSPTDGTDVNRQPIKRPAGLDTDSRTSNQPSKAPAGLDMLFSPTEGAFVSGHHAGTPETGQIGPRPLGGAAHVGEAFSSSGDTIDNAAIADANVRAEATLPGMAAVGNDVDRMAAAQEARDVVTSAVATAAAATVSGEHNNDNIHNEAALLDAHVVTAHMASSLFTNDACEGTDIRPTPAPKLNRNEVLLRPLPRLNRNWRQSANRNRDQNANGRPQESPTKKKRTTGPAPHL